MKLYGKSGALKYNTDCAPNNGYFLIPLYDKVSEELYSSVVEDSPSIHDTTYFLLDSYIDCMLLE